MNLTPGAVGVAVDRLEVRGLVARAEGKRDRRERVVALTKEGEKVISPVYHRHAVVLVVKDIVQEMIVLLRDEAVRHSMTIHSELDAETPNILADRVQLQQVCMNLMRNAIEAKKDTGGKLTTTA